MHPLLAPLTFTLLLTPFPTPALAQQARCQWATLRSATDSVLEALSAGLSSATTTPTVFSSPELVYNLNGTPLPLPLPASAGSVTSNSNTTGLWAAPLDVSVAHSVVDQDRCAAFIKVVGYPNTANPDADTNPEGRGGVLVVGAQVFYNYTAREGATVRRLDMVVAGEGDWNMPVALDGEVLAGLIKGEDWGALSRASQDGRGVLEGVAGSYLNRLGGNANGTEGVDVAWGRPCARLEGSVHTAVGEAESCEMGLDVNGGGEEGKGITERQFVVDESVGSVSVLARDGRLGDMPTAFEFKVVKGALRYVHQFTATASTETSN